HLLHHDHDVDETETDPAVGFGHEQRGPPELDHLVPDAVGEPALVVDHRAHVARRALAFHERADRPPEFFLVLVEGEVHPRAPSSTRNLTRASWYVDHDGLRPHGRRHRVPRRVAAVAR